MIDVMREWKELFGLLGVIAVAVIYICWWPSISRFVKDLLKGTKEW